MIAQDAAVTLQAASVCLRYPDDEVRAMLPTVRAAVAGLAPGRPAERLRAFLDAFGALVPTEAERHYVEVFDTRRRCCIYLTWWSDGETRRRGATLAALKARYRERGAELVGDELPDFLPVVLEFAATADLRGGLELLLEHRAGLELLRLALLEAGTPYAAPVEAVCALLPGPSPADVQEAKALARGGPPREQVGLELPPFSAVAPGGPR